jgi:Cu/Ag efflux protein CusF
MKRIKALAGVILLSTVTASFAQQQGTIEYHPIVCMLAGEMTVMQMTVKDKGILRAYFRRVGATDWCSVDGNNHGPVSSITMPKFDEGVEIEYYFVVIDGKQVVAKSPQIYRVKTTTSCETMVARHVMTLPMECLPAGANPIADSLAAGYAIRASLVDELPRFASPDRP